MARLELFLISVKNQNITSIKYKDFVVKKLKHYSINKKKRIKIVIINSMSFIDHLISLNFTYDCINFYQKTNFTQVLLYIKDLKNFY